MKMKITVGSALLLGPAIWFLPVHAEVCPMEQQAPSGKHAPYVQTAGFEKKLSSELATITTLPLFSSNFWLHSQCGFHSTPIAWTFSSRLSPIRL